MIYSQLKARAEDRPQPPYPRALVQVGGCTRSVGASRVMELLREEMERRSLEGSVVEAGCDGACYQAPVVIIDTEAGQTYRLTRVEPEDVADLVRGWLGRKPSSDRKWKGTDTRVDSSGFWSGQTRLVLENVGQIGATDLDDYVSRGGYSALDRVLSSLSPEQAVEQALDADLKGRGGAYFPAARKWQGARATGRSPRYLIVNAEEGEPGIYKDRHIMEGDPYRLLEGIAIAAYAIGAEVVYLYINGEAHLSAKRMAEALEKAHADTLVGENILGTDFGFQVEVRRGAGGYVLGEESALMNSIEGQRNVPCTRPPFPVESGLWGHPTVINNVETLANIPNIFAEDSDYFRLGTDAARGTKIISLTGRVQRPGLIEVPLGATISQIVYDIGGGPPEGHQVWGIVAGGPSGGLLPASMLDTAIGPGLLDSSGAVLGSGGITVLDDTVSPLEVVRVLAAYNAAESCSKCTPCREGTQRMLASLDRLAEGKGTAADLDNLTYTSDIVQFGSLCGLGQMAGGPIKSGLKHFGDEFRSMGIS
ncbi:MAG: NADH-ubiquinone oxidoreductase-F iron-sulfur binding region domain-containing protein [Dehalococcoidia bacterium]